MNRIFYLTTFGFIKFDNICYKCTVPDIDPGCYLTERYTLTNQRLDFGHLWIWYHWLSLHVAVTSYPLNVIIIILSRYADFVRYLTLCSSSLDLALNHLSTVEYLFCCPTDQAIRLPQASCRNACLHPLHTFRLSSCVNITESIVFMSELARRFALSHVRSYLTACSSMPFSASISCRFKISTGLLESRDSSCTTNQSPFIASSMTSAMRRRRQCMFPLTPSSWWNSTEPGCVCAQTHRSLRDRDRCFVVPY